MQRPKITAATTLLVAVSIDIVHSIDESIPAKYWEALVSVWNLKQDSWHTMTVSMPSTTCSGLEYELWAMVGLRWPEYAPVSNIRPAQRSVNNQKQGHQVKTEQINVRIRTWQGKWFRTRLQDHCIVPIAAAYLWGWTYILAVRNSTAWSPCISYNIWFCVCPTVCRGSPSDNKWFYTVSWSGIHQPHHYQLSSIENKDHLTMQCLFLQFWLSRINHSTGRTITS